MIVQHLGNLEERLRGGALKALPVYLMLSHYGFPVSLLLAVAMGKGSKSLLQRSNKARLQE